MRKLLMAGMMALALVFPMTAEAHFYEICAPAAKAGPSAPVVSQSGWAASALWFVPLQVLIFFAPKIIQSTVIQDAAGAVGLKTWSCNSCGDFPNPAK